MALTKIDDRGLTTPIDLLDSEKIRFGTGNDLEIYHDGTDSWIDSSTNNLAIRTTNAGHISIKTNNEYGIFCAANGATSLYYDNVKKIETTSGGAQIVNGTGNTQLNIRGGSSDGTATIQFTADDNAANDDNFRLRHGASNDFYLQNYASGSWETNIKAVGDGAVELYHNNSKKLETISAGVSISGELQVEDVEGTTLRLGNTDAAASDGDYLSGIDFHIKDNNDSTGAVCAAIRSHADQNHTASAKGTALTFHTTDDDTTTLDERIRITHDGKVGIGTGLPDNLLHLYESSTTQTASTESQLVLEKNSDSGITILSGYTSNGRILFGDSGDNDIGQIDYDHNNNSLTFVTAASTALTIDSSQKIGIGTASPDQLLHIYESATNSQAYLHLQNNRSRNCGVQFETTQGSWYVGQGIGADVDRFMIYDSAEKFSVDANGHAKIHDGNLVVANGHGIDFSATAHTNADDSVLDDYERGGFNPTVGGSTGSGTKSYTHQSGYYVKIGKIVHCWVDITIASASGMSGNFAIQSLPYAKTFHDSQNSYYEGGSFWNVADELSDSKPVAAGYMPNGYSWFYCYSADTQGSKTSFVLNTAGRVCVYFVYTTS